MEKGNGAGDYMVDAARDMRAFDRLELRVRDALRNVAFDIAAPAVRSYKNHKGVAATLIRIAELEAETLLGTRLETWGPEYPDVALMGH